MLCYLAQLSEGIGVPSFVFKFFLPVALIAMVGTV